MKKPTIIILGIVMGLSFLSLLYLQVKYIEEMVRMRKEQFDESVKRSLDQACHGIELAETKKYLEIDAEAVERAARMSAENLGLPDSTQHIAHYSIKNEEFGNYSSFEFKLDISSAPKTIISNGKNIPQTAKTLQDIIRDRYIYQKDLLDEVVYNILYTANNQPLRKRLNFKQLDLFLKTELLGNGIDIPYHFRVTDREGNVVYQCSDFDEEGMQNTYSRVIFRNDPPARMGMVKIHFPTLQSYIYSSVRFLIPSVIFTMVLLVTFIFTIYHIFRQKKLSEIKNDFINNMTHEFKTPISSISLAAQMLKDPMVAKSDTMFNQITNVIGDETKRLRFLVEKVLQMSMFEQQNTSMNLRDIDANALIESVAKTFTLKVEKYGGSIDTRIEAHDALVLADEMHFTNVIFNLLDNAVKYKRHDVELHLSICTWNENNKLYISIQDNGLGIKKEDLKKIFDKFYRVHTGNRHDVKGFGLGLAYVKKVIANLKGTIRAESSLNVGTKFIIALPLLKNN